MDTKKHTPCIMAILCQCDFKEQTENLVRFLLYMTENCEDNIRRDLQEVGGDCGNWMEWAQDRDRWRALVSTVMNFRVP
jgi:hypothetical protein